jgi:hypothetical protein
VVVGRSAALRRLDLHDGVAFADEWADRPHEPVTLMRVRARVTDSAPGTTIAAGTSTVRGTWSGTGPVTQVDVSFNRRRRLALG